MEIIKRATISFGKNFEKVDAVIDTGADKTMIDEEVLLKLGASHIGNMLVHSMGEFEDKKPLYYAYIEIDGCQFFLQVIGGKKNIVGHDFLRLAKAIINEANGEVKLTKNYVDM